MSEVPSPPGPAAPPGGGLRGRLHAVGDFFTRQRHLMAVRDGVVGALPLVLTGSLFLLIAQPPSEALQRWIAPYTPVVLVPYRMLGGLIAVYVTYCAAHSLARSYQLDAMAAGLLAMAAYLIAAMPTPVGPPAGPPAIPLARLGASGIFAGLLIALGSVELIRFFVRRNWTIQLPSSAPETVVRSFVALIPGFAVVTAIFLLVHVLGVDLISLLDRAVRPLMVATGSLPATLLVVGADSALWTLGVHGSAAITPLRPLWEAMLVQNMEAAASGAAPPNIAPLPFYQWFIWQGGSGATLALALLLLRARSTQLRGVGRLALVPALFNINEPILFGAPVVMNPTLAIPFLLAPLACAASAYLAFHLHLVHRVYLEMPWTLPAPLGAFLATGGDARAIALQLFNLGLSMLIYWPFLRRYDLRLRSQEVRAQEAGRVAAAGGAG